MKKKLRILLQGEILKDWEVACLQVIQRIQVRQCLVRQALIKLQFLVGANLLLKVKGYLDLADLQGVVYLAKRTRRIKLQPDFYLAQNHLSQKHQQVACLAPSLLVCLVMQHNQLLTNLKQLFLVILLKNCKYQTKY